MIKAPNLAHIPFMSTLCFKNVPPLSFYNFDRHEPMLKLMFDGALFSYHT